MKAVVTGGAGFVGSNLAHRLVDDGHEVVIVDDLATGHRHNLPKGARFLEGSILDADLLRRAFSGADVVFHEAALGSVPRSLANPLASHHANATGTLSVLEGARQAGVGKVVYASSSSAYGDTPTLPKVEDMPARPLSPYAVTKLAAEQYCVVYNSAFGLRTTSLRYFNVFGPRQDPDSPYAAVIPRFIRAALRGDPLTIHGDGTQSRDFTYVDNVIEANLLAAASTKADGRVVNAGAGARTDLNTLARHIIELAGSTSSVQHGPIRAGDVRDSLASLALAHELTGYEPKVALRDGLRQTVAWYRARGA